MGNYSLGRISYSSGHINGRVIQRDLDWPWCQIWLSGRITADMKSDSHPRLWNDILFALALGQLSVFRLGHLLKGPSLGYFLQDRGAVQLLMADMLAGGLLAGFLFLLFFRLSFIPARFHQAAPFVPLLLAASDVLMTRNGGWFEHRRVLASCLLLGGLCLFSYLYARVRATRKFLRNGCMAAAAVTTLGIINAALNSRSIPSIQSQFLRNSSFVRRDSGKSVSATPGASPVLWILFDELDQHALESSFAGDLPNFRAVQAESLIARSAIPAAYWTLAAVPSMLTGKLLNTTDALRPATTSGKFGETYWAAMPNLFSELRTLSNGSSRGMSTGLMGWYHPYCQVLASSVDDCFGLQTETRLIEAYLRREPFWKRLDNDWREILRAVPFLPSRYPGDSAAHREIYTAFVEALPRLLEIRPDFLLLHVPVPHPPFINERRSGYAGNLQLADSTLGMIRNTLKSNGTWDRTSVLVSGDHHLRLNYWGADAGAEAIAMEGGREDPRTAFLFKPRGSRQAVFFTPAFNMVLVHDLLLAAAAGHFDGPDAVSAWLEKNKGRFPVLPPVM